MPVYNVRVWFDDMKNYEIEAKDIAEAKEKATEQCMEEECPDNISDVEATLSDCQYTDQEELQDEEDRYDKKV